MQLVCFSLSHCCHYLSMSYSCFIFSFLLISPLFCLYPPVHLSLDTRSSLLSLLFIISLYLARGLLQFLVFSLTLSDTIWLPCITGSVLYPFFPTTQFSVIPKTRLTLMPPFYSALAGSGPDPTRPSSSSKPLLPVWVS